MKQYRQTDLKNLRHRPATDFVQSMEAFLSCLPDKQYIYTSDETIADFRENSFHKQCTGLFKAVLASAAVLLFTVGMTLLLRSHIFGPKEIIVQKQSSSIFETASGPEEVQLILPLDRIDIHVEPDLLWNNETGILAEGEQIVKSSSLPYKNSTYRKMRKQDKRAEGEIEYRSAQTGLVFRQRISMQLDEDYYSMDMPQKGLMVDAMDGWFNYPLFDDRQAAAYASILLRNAGNDCLFTRVADGVQSRLIDSSSDVDLLTLAWKPVNVYLNNEYWGIYNMRESLDAYTVCRHEGIDWDTAGSITILRLNGTPIQGSGDAYRELISVICRSDPANQDTDRAYLEQQIDIDSYLEWLAVKIYFGDTDAASTFVCYQIPGEKWKCLAQDFDYGLFHADYDAVYDLLKESGMGPVNVDNRLFRKILEVDDYRQRFLQKIGRLYQTFTTEEMQQALDECVALIEPDMVDHLARWAPCNENTLNPDAPTDPAEAWQYWKKRIQRMREGTMVNRPRYVYEQIQSFFDLTDSEMKMFFGN